MVSSGGCSRPLYTSTLGKLPGADVSDSYAEDSHQRGIPTIHQRIGFAGDLGYVK